jgi:hypothetical protein
MTEAENNGDNKIRDRLLYCRADIFWEAESLMTRFRVQSNSFGEGQAIDYLRTSCGWCPHATAFRKLRTLGQAPAL